MSRLDYCTINDIVRRLEYRHGMLRQPYMALALEHFDEQESEWCAISLREGFGGGWARKIYMRIYLPDDEGYDEVNRRLEEACKQMNIKFQDLSKDAKAARATKRDKEAHALELLDRSMVVAEGGGLQGFT